MPYVKKPYREIVDEILDQIATGNKLTDKNVGSVVRTITEAFSREIATLYAQMEKVYKAGFIDTAEGRSLEHVVSVLDIERLTAEYAIGRATFSRSTPAPADITIPEGTVVSAPAKPPERPERVSFETTEEKTLREEETSIEIPIKATVAGNQGVVQAGEISIMNTPPYGIETVKNEDPTVLPGIVETDEQLRARAKRALEGAGRATSNAIKFAVLREGVGSVTLRDMPNGIVGELDVIVDGEGLEPGAPKRMDVERAIEESRAAGIKANLRVTKSTPIDLTITLELADAELTASEIRGIEADVETKIQNYISSLQPGENLLGNQIIALALSNPLVRNVVSITPNGGDIAISQFEKAIAGKLIFAMQVKPPELTTPVYIDLVIFATYFGAPEKMPKTRQNIESKFRAYISGLGESEDVIYEDLISYLASPDYAIHESPTKLSALHTVDGLTITDVGRDIKIREHEKAEPRDIVVNLTS